MARTADRSDSVASDSRDRGGADDPQRTGSRDNATELIWTVVGLRRAAAGGIASADSTKPNTSLMPKLQHFPCRSTTPA